MLIRLRLWFAACPAVSSLDLSSQLLRSRASSGRRLLCAVPLASFTTRIRSGAIGHFPLLPLVLALR